MRAARRVRTEDGVKGALSTPVYSSARSNMTSAPWQTAYSIISAHGEDAREVVDSMVPNRTRREMGSSEADGGAVRSARVMMFGNATAELMPVS
jgi:hypothetical protein